MTRINANIDVAKLCDQHLLAEHREIKRLTNLVESKSEPPKNFKLGSGHVLWFKYRLGFAKERYSSLYKECLKRGFNVTDYSKNWDNIPDKFMGSWKPTEYDNQIITERINERLDNMKNIHYFSERKNSKYIKNL